MEVPLDFPNSTCISENFKKLMRSMLVIKDKDRASWAAVSEHPTFDVKPFNPIQFSKKVNEGDFHFIFRQLNLYITHNPVLEYYNKSLHENFIKNNKYLEVKDIYDQQMYQNEQPVTFQTQNY